MKPILIDTGVIVALLDRSEQSHPKCASAVEAYQAPLLTCEAVIAESCYLLGKLPGASECVLENVIRGVFQIPFQLSSAAAGVHHILKKYRDVRIDFADACLIHLAGETKTGDILTLDRDFEFYRWGNNKPFHLLVPLT